jgi:cytochrome c biogenesis protein
MATSETEVKSDSQSVQTPAAVNVRLKKQEESVIDKVLKLLSSVRFGLVMLSMLLICSMIGMLIMQVEVEGFQEYFAKLTPAQRLVYTKLDLNNIYHSKFFTFLLAITALNIILASIDRFPTAWQYVVNPKLKASPNFIRAQMFTSEMASHQEPKDFAEKVKGIWTKRGFRARISEENNRITIFAQRSAWNRLGAYFVHVALLTIFVGGFLTNQFGIGGSMEIVPGETSDEFTTLASTLEGPKTGQAKLPFKIECTDLQQKLIRPEGGLEATNTIDWLSYVRIKDGNFNQDATVHLNNPYDYKGYRLFQSKFTAFGFARSVKIRLEPINGGAAIDVPSIPRTGPDGKNGSVDVPGIGRITYTNFFPDFKITDSGPTSISPDYNKPAAQLEVISPDGKKTAAFAFSSALAEQYLTNIDTKSGTDSLLLLNGNKVLLVDFEKAAMGHTLAVQYDPGRTPVYIGFIMLVASLCSVFFFAHQRVWAVVEPAEDGSKVHFGGNTNRNRPAFEGRFNSLVEAVTGGGKK